MTFIGQHSHRHRPCVSAELLTRAKLAAEVLLLLQYHGSVLARTDHAELSRASPRLRGSRTPRVVHDVEQAQSENEHNFADFSFSNGTDHGAKSIQFLEKRALGGMEDMAVQQLQDEETTRKMAKRLEVWVDAGMPLWRAAHMLLLSQPIGSHEYKITEKSLHACSLSDRWKKKHEGVALAVLRDDFLIPGMTQEWWQRKLYPPQKNHI